MNEENKKLIEENLNLIYWLCHTHNINAEDDIQDIVLEVCKRIDNYDPSKGALATFLNVLVYHRKIRQQVTKYRQKRVPPELLDSLEEKISVDDCKGNSVPRLETIPDSEGEFCLQEVEMEFLLQELFLAYSNRYPKNCDKKIKMFISYLNNYTYEQIGHRYNISRQRVYQIIRDMCKFFKSFYDNELTLPDNLCYNSNIKNIHIKNGEVLYDESSC